MDFQGKIIAVLPPREGVAKSTNTPWKVQSYVIENHDQYPRKMCFDIFGEDKISQFNIQMGEELSVSFDIDARQWQDRWFNSIRAWKVERVALGDSSVMNDIPGSAPSAIPSSVPFAEDGNNGSSDDLPF